MFKRILSTVLSLATVVGMIPHIPAKAEENSIQPYPYTIFASSNEEGAITVNSENFHVNGNVATNGTIVSSANINISGAKTELAEESMIYIFDKIDTRYFSGVNIDKHENDYRLEELNININTPTDVNGEATLNGNININNALKALEDVNLSGEVKNTNDSVIFSKYGDIIIESQNVNLNGLVYAPFGSVTINAQNLNLNNVVIIAETITITSPNVNANYNSNFGSFVGNQSEECPIISIDKSNFFYNADYDFYYATDDFNELCGYLGKSDSFDTFRVEVFDITNTIIYSNELERNFRWKDNEIGLMTGLNKISLTASKVNGEEYTCTMDVMIDSSKFIDNLQIDLDDNDGDGLWNYIEHYCGTDPDKADTDDDGLNDFIEIYSLGYNPFSEDTDSDGIPDGKEDEDEDGLTNEYEVNIFHSSPIADDTDHEGLSDSDELKYSTSPTMRDTDEDGISDYDELFIFNLNPLIAEPSNIQLTKTFTVEDMNIEYDKAVFPTITLRGDIDCIKNFSMSKLDRTPVINLSTVGYLGAAYDFRTSGTMNGATLTFTYDPELIMEIDQSEQNFTPAIYYFNEQTYDLEEVPNQTWEGNQVTAEIEHFSIYLLLNKTALECFWNTVLETPDDYDDNSGSIERQIAFILDNSGSMDWNDSENLRGELVRKFCGQLEPTDSVSIYGFNDSVINYCNNKFICDKNEINVSIDQFINEKNIGGTYIANALTSAYYDLLVSKYKFEQENTSSPTNLYQYVFLLTDGVSADKPSSSLLSNYNEKGIKIYTVGFGSANLSYLKMISDSTLGKSYSADTVSDLDDIFLKFNKELDTTDKNRDNIPDYYEYLMCQGIITTRTGTKIFEGYTYDEVMANNDLDDDGLLNGEEVYVWEVNGKPYAFVCSDPTLIYTDNDCYDDFEEYLNGTSSHEVDYLIMQEDYDYLKNGSNYSFTESAFSYLNENSDKELAIEYFIDVTFCGSETYFDTIKQGAQDWYYKLTVKGGKVGSENMLMKQDKVLLCEYLSELLELPDEKTGSEMFLETSNQIINDSLDFYDGLENLMKVIKGNNKYEFSDDIISYMTDKMLKKEIDSERQKIRKLQSDIDIEIRRSVKEKTFSPEKKADFARRQKEISKRQSDIDRDVFKKANEPKIEKRYKDISKKVDFGITFATTAYSRMNQLEELVKYSQQLAAFEQYRDFITELSHSEFDYVAVAADELLKDLDSKQESGYKGRGAFEYLKGSLSDVADIGIDKGIDIAVDKCGGEVTMILEIVKFVVSTVVGDNYSYERQNLLSADLSSQITMISVRKIESICGSTEKLFDGYKYFIASGSESCIFTNQYMLYLIVTRKLGEEKYIELGTDKSGLLGLLFDYNVIEKNYGSESIDHAKMNLIEISYLIDIYNKVFR